MLLNKNNLGLNLLIRGFVGVKNNPLIYFVSGVEDIWIVGDEFFTFGEYKE